MITFIIKILNKLKNNIEKYDVVGEVYKDNDITIFPFPCLGHVEYTIDGIFHSMNVFDECITFSISHKKNIKCEYPDDSTKYEVLKLVSEIENRCKEYVCNQIISFANYEEQGI